MKRGGIPPHRTPEDCMDTNWLDHLKYPGHESAVAKLLIISDIGLVEGDDIPPFPWGINSECFCTLLSRSCTPWLWLS